MWLIVTPCRNEADNLQGLHLSLRSQRNMPSHLWVIVDDGSTDDTSLIAEQVASQHPNAIVVRRANSGGLSGGSAYKAWQFGVEQGLRYLTGTTPSVVMKLDADVRLGVDYFDQLKGHERSGAFGGFMQGRRHREQTLHIPGPVKAYSWAGYLCLDELPRTVGFDVVDEVLLRARGFQTQVVPRASFTMARDIGASEGRIRGRYRNGMVCRITGYAPEYFLLHALRYMFRRPYAVGALAMILGYVASARSPYADAIRQCHAEEQRAKLAAMKSSPIPWLQATYGMNRRLSSDYDH